MRLAALGTVMLPQALLMPKTDQECQARQAKDARSVNPMGLTRDLLPYRKDFSCSPRAQQEKCGPAGDLGSKYKRYLQGQEPAGRVWRGVLWKPALGAAGHRSLNEQKCN